MDKEIWTNIINEGAYSNELDWIAIDTCGQVGVFTTIMNAPIPTEIGKSYDLYIQLMSIISGLNERCSAIRITPNNGDLLDWDVYARKGLYAFDYQDVHREQKDKRNQYDLISKPSAPLHIEELDLNNLLISIIPKINCDFRDGDVLNEKINL
jgi:hypothetical protein